MKRILLGSLAALLLTGCYQIEPQGQYGAWKINRLTGAVSYCTPTECAQLAEHK